MDPATSDMLIKTVRYAVMIFAAAYMIHYLFVKSFELHEWFCEKWHDVSPVGQVVLALPFLVVTLWCLLLNIINLIGNLLLGYQVAKWGRDWWHKGGK